MNMHKPPTYAWLVYVNLTFPAYSLFLATVIPLRQYKIPSKFNDGGITV